VPVLRNANLGWRGANPLRAELRTDIRSSLRPENLVDYGGKAQYLYRDWWSTFGLPTPHEPRSVIKFDRILPLLAQG